MGRERAAIRALVRGIVQGVGFRWSASEKAASLGLSGWVRNRADGSVELVAEGDPGDLDEFLRWLAEGPPGARVEGVEASAVPATGLFPSFRIEH